MYNLENACVAYKLQVTLTCVGLPVFVILTCARDRRLQVVHGITDDAAARYY